MDAKKHLGELKRLEREIDSRKKHLEALKADVQYLKGLSYDGVRVQASPSGESAAQKDAEKIADLEAELKEEITKYHLLRRKITLEIEQMPNESSREVLTMIYLEGMSLHEIADKKGYSYDWIKHRHSKALQAFENQESS